MAEMLKWLEHHISLSLQPKLEELKAFMSSSEYRIIMHGFFTNEQNRRMYIYIKTSKEIVASYLPPMKLASKSLFFIKCHSNGIITRDNIDDEVQYFDCLPQPSNQLRLETREVYLPILCNNSPLSKSSGYGEDKLLNVLHSLMYLADIGQGLYKGQVVLALPSLDVLLNATTDPKRSQAVKYLLETTVLSWISEIKTLLHHDGVADLFTNFSEEPTPSEEVKMWELHLEHLTSLCTQLDSPMAQYVIQRLKQFGSQYTQSMAYIKGEIHKEIIESSKVLSSFYPLWKWYNRICRSTKFNKTLKLFKPLVTTLSLLWTNSPYYHEKSKFCVVIQILCNGIVKYALSMIGNDILTEPLKSHRELKKALQICASFRGTYLDVKAETDAINAKNLQLFNEKRPKQQDIREKLFGVSYGRQQEVRKEVPIPTEEDRLIQNSPWPHRNSACFQTLNTFMERCNDILELVETAEHFQVLSGVAEIGGIGNIGIDLLVKDISVTYADAIEEFFDSISNVMDIKEAKSFDYSFFKLRSMVKTLEVKLSNILYQALEECPSAQSKRRLLEVFQTICCRPQVRASLSDITSNLVTEYWTEVCQLEKLFEMQQKNPPRHQHFSGEASQIIWIEGLINQTEILMSNMKGINSHVLEGGNGWEIKEHYEEIIVKFKRYKSQATDKWLFRLENYKSASLKETLLVAEDYDDTVQERPSVLHVTLSDDFLIIIHEILYFCHEPFLICNQTNIENLIGDMSLPNLQASVTKLQQITITYNSIMKLMKNVEKPLFEAKLLDIDQLIEQGTEKFTWKMKESTDFIESAISLICTDLYHNLSTLQDNSNAILDITRTWNESQIKFPLTQTPLSIEQLLGIKNQILQSFSEMLIPSNHKIHSLVASSAQVVNVSEASPCWQDYLTYIDLIVLAGLKKTIYSYLDVLGKHIEKEESRTSPLLRLNVILLDKSVDFSPCLDQNTYHESIHEVIQQWIKDVVKKSDLLTMLAGEQSYKELLVRDAELQELVTKIDQGVKNTVAECKKVAEKFEEYSHLWLEEGDVSQKDMQDSEYQEEAEQNYDEEHWNLERKKTPPSRLSFYSERNEAQENNLHQLNLKSLETFDAEAEKYMNLKEKILTLPAYEDIGWIRVNQEPIKQTINAIVSKWLWSSTKTLVSQVTQTLQDLDQYMKGLEAEMEFMSNRKKDILSFTRIMRLFNEVSSAHSRMESDFGLINKTMEFLKKYQHELQEDANQLYESNPIRWNNLKTKVSLAKQNLGPTIQEESASILKELNAFNARVSRLLEDIADAPVTKQDCDQTSAANIIHGFKSRQKTLEIEAMDLKELEDLLEISVLKTDELNQCQDQLMRIEDVWRAVRYISKNHSQWKACFWQKVNVSLLKKEIAKELKILEAISEKSQPWEIYKNICDSVKTLQECVSLIEDLRNPAMRTRHWRQFLRVTNAPVDSELLNQLTLHQFLQLNFQSCIVDVQAIVQRAVKELVVEKAMKTCEEVWLSRIFQLEIRKLPTIEFDFKHQADSRRSSQMYLAENELTPSTGRSSSTTHDGRISISASRLSMIDGEVVSIAMLIETDALFQELTHHQMTLNNLLQCQNTTSFNDEITKWQGQLLMIESIVILWLQVQEKWDQLIEAFALPETQTLLPNETRKFFKGNFQFCRFMKSVERNSNILQNCTKKWIQPFLESLLLVFEKCYKALLNHVRNYKEKFPRFYFLTPKEILEFVCYGRNLSLLNSHLRKLFHNISYVHLRIPEDGTSVPIITALLSQTKESLLFQEPLVCDGPVENWLVKLESLIKESLKDQLLLALKISEATLLPNSSLEISDVKNQILNEKDQSQQQNSEMQIKESSSALDYGNLESLYQNWKWLLDSPTEIIILISKIKLTKQILWAIEGNFRDKQKAKLKECLEIVNTSLMEITKILWNLEKRNPLLDTQEVNEIKQPSKFPEENVPTLNIHPSVHTQQLAKLEAFLLNQSMASVFLKQLIDLCQQNSGHSELDFTWKRQIKYFFDTESRKVTIKCLDCSFDYGFEYQGSAKREVITESTEKAFLGLLHALTNFKVGHCIGPLDGRKLETIKELSFCLGKALFLHNYSAGLNKSLLEDVLNGIILTGNWLCLNSVSHLKTDQMLLLAEKFESQCQSLKNKHSSNGQMDKTKEIVGAIFTMQDSDLHIGPYNPDKITIYPAVYSTLPDSLLNQLRPVACLKPCIRQVLEILLLSFGFTHGYRLSKQMTQFIEYMQKLGSLNYGISVGFIDPTEHVTTVTCTLAKLQLILNKAFKFLVFEKSTEDEDLLARSEILLHFEVKALVRALQQYWMPLLRESDFLLAKKLIDHIWPETITETNNQLSSTLSGSEEMMVLDAAINNHDVASTKCLSMQPGADNSCSNLNTLINAAIGDLKLGSSSSFHAKIKQLYLLGQTHSMVMVVGPPGCGKSTCIDSYVALMKQKGVETVVENLFLKSQESSELMGYMDFETNEWIQGFLPNILEKVCKNDNLNDKAEHPVNSLIHLDGKADVRQMESLQDFLTHMEVTEFGNCERLFLPENLKVFWEVEDMRNLNPTFVCQVGIFQMTSSDIGWQVLWKRWLVNQAEKSQEILQILGEKYLPHLFQYCLNSGQFIAGQVKVDNSLGSCKWIVKQTPDNMLHALFSYWQALENSLKLESFQDYEYCFSFACIWSFAGCLIRDHRNIFDSWWREVFSDHLFPGNGTVFDFKLDSCEGLKFVPWSQQSNGHQFVMYKKSSDFIPTEKTEQLSHLLGLLIDVQMPAMLVGDNGCGKTHILSEKLQTLSSGEMAESRSLFIHANSFTTAKFLQKRFSEYTEWKYGSIYMPKSGKRLYCCIDDINFSKVDTYGDQSAIELVRQHMDLGGFYHYKTKKWQNMRDVIYMATLNPNPSADLPKLNPRLLRHFALLGTVNSGLDELQTLFRGVVSQNLFSSEHLIQRSSSKQDEQNKEKELEKLLGRIIHCTVELYLKLQTMFLATPQRSHYLFTVNGMKSIFKNLCLSIRADSEDEELLQLWQHECSWEFQQKMINEVDLHRYHVAFKAAVKKVFTNKVHIGYLAENRDDVFSNIVETESGRVIASTQSYRSSLPEQPGGPDTDHYRPVRDQHSLRLLLNKSIEEYNKNNHVLKIPLYKVINHEDCVLLCSDALLKQTLWTLYDCYRRITRIIFCTGAAFCFPRWLHSFPVAKTIPNQSKEEQISFFKTQLIGLCMKAGLKDEKILLQINEDDVVSDDALVLLLEFICHGQFTNLISSEQQTNIVNTIRGDVHHASLASSLQHPWQYFLQRVNTNLHIFLIIANSSRHYQRWCRQFPSLVKNTNFVWICHWTKKQLIHNAMHHIQNLEWMSAKQQENTCHLLASMHKSLRQIYSKEKGLLFKYCNNTTYQTFVQRFVHFADLRYQSVLSDHKMALDASEYTQRVEEEARQITQRIEHETLLMEQNKISSKLLLHQIGQDSTIAKQQDNYVIQQKKMISRLRKLLPDYQVAHQRAVYKTVHTVTNTKKLLQKIDLEDLSTLRSMQKPVLEVEDVLAAVIIIVKSPSADLTWHKGAKRIMANIERFVGELMTFDDYALPVSAMELVEEYINKPTFKPDHVTQVSANSACGILCEWVINVLRYHRIMSTKVKPLHEKVNVTIASISKAENQLGLLKERSKELSKRIAKLSKNFEEASMSTRRHEIFLNNTEKYFAMSTEVQQMMKHDKEILNNAINQLDKRLEAVQGISAITAGLVTYLGPCQHSLRQLVLTVIWPNLLHEKGISLIYDQIHHHKGYVVEWSFDSLRETSSQYLNTNEVGKQEVDLTAEIIPEEGEDEEDENPNTFLNTENQSLEPDKFNDKSAMDVNSQIVPPKSACELPQKLPVDKTTESESFDSMTNCKNESSEDRELGWQQSKEKQKEFDQEEPEKESVGDEYLQETDSWSGVEDNSFRTNFQGWQPTLSSEDYKRYLHTLLKMLVEQDILNKWIRDDVNVHHLENAAILWASQDNNVFLVDPYKYGENWFEELTHYRQQEAVQRLDLNHFDYNSRESLLNSMEQGKSVLMNNYSGFLDYNVEFLLHHKPSEDSHTIIKEKCLDNGCFSLNNHFRLCITTSSEKTDLPVDVGSLTTILNYGCCMNVLNESLLTRIFQKLRPALNLKLVQAQKSLESIRNQMKQMKTSVVKSMALNVPGENTIKDSISILLKWFKMRNKESEFQERIVPVIKIFTEKKLELQELANRATILYQLLHSFKYIQPHYYFPLSEFLNTLDDILAEDEQILSAGLDLPQKTKTDIKENKCSAPAYSDNTENGEILLLTDEQFQLPDLPILPTSGVDYTSLSTNKMRHLVDTLTHRILRRMQMCLHENDWLLFQTMVYLTIQTNDAGLSSWEEFSLLVQGNPGISIQLTLQDFQCNADPPSWLPPACWNNILALSVLNGPLDSLCVQLVENSQLWQLWFESEMPELESFPPDDSSETGIFSEFHQLLIIRNLRPDRFLRAMQIYLKNYGFYSLEPIKFSDILQAGVSYHGFLISTPAEVLEDPASWLHQLLTPQERLQQLAQESNIRSKLIMISTDGNTKYLDKLKSEIQEGFTWIIVNLTENCSHQFLQELSQDLDNGYWNQHHFDGNDLSRPRLWLIHKLSDTLPESIHKHFLKVAWFNIEGIVVEHTNEIHNFPIPEDYLWTVGERKSVCKDPRDICKDSRGSLQTDFLSSTLQHGKKEEEKKRQGDEDGVISPKYIHQATIVKYLHQTSTFVQKRFGEISPSQKLLIFAVTVAHSVLSALQDFGSSSGLGQWYSFHQQLLPLVLEAVLQHSLSHKQKADVFALLKSIPEFFYNHYVLNRNDRSYVEMIFNQILHSIVHNPTQDISIFGAYQIPIPPANIDLADYPTWFQRKCLKSEIPDSTSVLQIPSSISKSIDTRRNKNFFAFMNTIYEHQTMDESPLSEISGSLSEDQLRSALELCTDELPPLLEFDHLKINILKLHQNVNTEGSVSDENYSIFKEVIMQESFCYNHLMQSIHEEVNELKGKLVQGIKTVHGKQVNLMESLQKLQVPISWHHRGWVASCYTLPSWIEASKRQYQQLKTLCEQFSLLLSSLDQGGLSLWLGGMSNPIACITALQLDAALNQKCPLEKMSFSLVMLDSTSLSNKPSALSFHDVYLSGADWDHEHNCFLKSSNQIHHFSTMVLEIKQNNDDEDKTPAANIYICPIYTNPSRLVCVCMVEMITPLPAKELIHTQVAIFLNLGCLDGDYFHPEYVYPEYPEVGLITMNNTKQMSQQLTENINSVRPEENNHSATSDPSQLSYRVLTPKADPLPPTLRLKKELAFSMMPSDQPSTDVAITKNEKDKDDFCSNSLESRNNKLSTNQSSETENSKSVIPDRHSSQLEENLLITARQYDSTLLLNKTRMKASPSMESEKRSMEMVASANCSEYLGQSEVTPSVEGRYDTNFGNPKEMSESDSDEIRFDKSTTRTDDNNMEEPDFGVVLDERNVTYLTNEADKRNTSTPQNVQVSRSSKSFEEQTQRDSHEKGTDDVIKMTRGGNRIEEKNEQREGYEKRIGEEENSERKDEGGKERKVIDDDDGDGDGDGDDDDGDKVKQNVLVNYAESRGNELSVNTGEIEKEDEGNMEESKKSAKERDGEIGEKIRQNESSKRDEETNEVSLGKRKVEDASLREKDEDYEGEDENEDDEEEKENDGNMTDDEEEEGDADAAAAADDDAAAAVDDDDDKEEDDKGEENYDKMTNEEGEADDGGGGGDDDDDDDDDDNNEEDDDEENDDEMTDDEGRNNGEDGDDYEEEDEEDEKVRGRRKQ